MSQHIVVVGSGLGGLVCGVILAKNGYRITVLEQGAQPGGCLQCFTRHGAKFETGMHFVGSALPGQTLDRMMHFLELSDDVVLDQLDPSGYDVIALQGRRFKIPVGRERFINQLTEYFPSQHRNLERYYDLIEEVANASSLHSMKYADTDKMVSLDYQLRSVNEVIDEIITDPLLASVLVGNLPLYAAEKDKTPFSQHAFIMDFYNQSAFRFVGGSDTVVHSLVKTIRRYGGEVHTKSRVTQIVCDNQRATAVRLENGEHIACDYVISDAHPKRTLELLQTHLLRPAFRRRVCSIPQTVGSFVVYLRFKPQTMPYMNYNLYGYRGSTPWDCEQYDDKSWPKGYLYMHLCHQRQPRWAQTGVILSYMHMADVSKWAGTTVGHRGADYEQFKHEHAERLLDAVEKEVPGLRDSIAEYYTSTPLTYLDYTGTEDGSMYGLAKDIHKTAEYRVSHRLKVPNVFQTGQNINSHGMLGVLVGSIVTCSELVPAKTIYQQIVSSEETAL